VTLPRVNLGMRAIQNGQRWCSESPECPSPPWVRIGHLTLCQNHALVDFVDALHRAEDVARSFGYRGYAP
jgi:hypothetical protein